ncbi:MAG TPA: 7-carboxy-7-deazaguanine synthase QueE [Candidatus Omnitrophota bacterium]|nr:7-carboxy-7-deazaguanine synthase QueE [Candidatus Omnitrophota bacterium]
MRAAISEIFSSLQGEGLHMGERHLFVRFSGCDVNCCYCDEHSGRGADMTVREALAAVETLEAGSGPHSFVSLTGGEPLQQPDFLRGLTRKLKECGYRVLLETNGICPRALDGTVELFDSISMDIKLSSVGRHPDFSDAHAEFLKIVRRTETELCLKIVVAETMDFAEFDRHIGMIAEVAPETPVFIQQRQGERVDVPYLERAIQTARQRIADVRLGFQLHKMLNMK